MGDRTGHWVVEEARFSWQSKQVLLANQNVLWELMGGS